jgi:salicylate 5-hydroxylase small subunit
MQAYARRSTSAASTTGRLSSCEDWPLQGAGARELRPQLPLALIALESQGMMKDRVYGITQTIYHGPYYTRHVVSPAQVLADEGERIRSQSHYAVFRTKPGDASEVYNVGRYIDEIVRTPGGLKLASRTCVYDSEMVLNSLIYPI